MQSELSKNQKEFYLRQQMRAIQKELGEGDARSAEIEELRKKLDDGELPAEARKAAEAELDRLRIIPPESAEHTVVRTYLEWLRQPAVERLDRGQPRHPARPRRCSTRTTTTWRRSRTASSSTSPCAS